ncbi:uncharacterized protein LOC117103750 [Anneissia japonica]|uniref:uncharacterized protein LOC117103750 n=1 Tax=Anneissia japonica TaxID=1529436 RepID=UPI0014258666|nr:uncharacterized protein LOC117103750 [Anneissia japonica]
MATKTSLYIIFVAVCLLHTTESRCVDVPVEYCRRLGFTGTYFPNHFYHRSISEAVAAFHQFIAADGECSDDFGKFVCAAYFPGCTLANNLRVDIRFNPCRKLCNSAFKPCKLSFKRLKIKWPPELRCGTFPTKECTSVMDELVPHIPMPPTPAPSDISCETISYMECQNLGYDKTTMPNRFGQTTQETAGVEVDHFKPLIGVQCSEALQTFVCASFFPPCSDTIAETPCRSLCEAAKDGCVQIMRSFGYEWPEHLRCSDLPNDTPVESQCEPLTIPLCQDLGYTSTMMPNMLGQNFQQDAQMTLQTFAPLLQTQCSPALKLFLCAAYAPSCSASSSQMPCRSLCEEARDGCLPTLETFGFGWPGPLNCSSLSNENCYNGGFSTEVQNPEASTMPTQVESQCEPLTISLCQDLGYTSTKMPNMFGQSFQQDAQMTLQTFVPLLQTQCSPALKPFLCAAYAPSCSASTSQMPCRSLCEAARDGCLPTLETFGFGWPGPLNCSSLSNENCYDGGFSTEVQNPDGSCEDIILPMCLNMSYSQTRLPNVLGHTSQFDALTAIIDNVILVGCSPTILPFLCSVYTPMCTADGSAKPCRSLCQQTMYECQQLLTLLNLKWPEELECSNFTDDDPSCNVDDIDSENDTSILRCEPLRNPHCEGLSYDRTQIPNMLGDVDQDSAVLMMTSFAPMIATGCSPKLKALVCAVVSPPCSSGVQVQPCRSLCEAVERDCGSIFPNGTDAELAFPCFLLPNQNCYDGKTTIGISPTVSSDEVEMYTDEIAIVGHEVSDMVAYGSNCEKINSRRYDVTDLGLSEYFRGWVDVQGQGAANDYCRVVRGENGNLDLTCALAGTSGMSEFNYNITSLDGENFIPGRYGEWYIRDENGDGRDDYCRCVYRDFSLFVSCIPAMAEGFVGNEEFRVEAKGCGVEQFNPFIGPRP